jgi:hypothetical protein
MSPGKKATAKPAKGGSPRRVATDDAADTARFVRGLTIGLIVGAVIAGSTLWRRFGPLRPRS